MKRLTELSCRVIRRELAVASGTIAPERVVDHLRSCPDCAELAGRYERLDKVWDATRPAEPAAHTWDALWARVQAVAVAPTPAPSAFPSPRGGLIWGLAALAQAAAILLAWWLILPHGRTGERPGPGGPLQTLARTDVAQPASIPPVPAAVAQVEYELEEGQTLFLVLDRRADRVIVRPRFIATADLAAFDGDTPDPFATAVQMDLVVLNVMEGLEWAK